MTKRFELRHLESYDDESLLDEIRRVAAVVQGSKLTQELFNSYSKVHSSTIQKRFRGWRRALDAAGLKDKIDQSGLTRTKEEIVEAIKQVSSKLQKSTLTQREFTAHTGISHSPVKRLFGTWGAAIEAAGLSQSPLGKRYTDEQCFENMLTVWTHYGRPPQHDEMNLPPSEVGAKAYVRRWGTWRKALEAFVQRVNADDPVSKSTEPTTEKIKSSGQSAVKPVERGPRDVPLALRYYVLRRDDFRCVTCGASPAITRGVVLHIDHIKPWALGGPTVADNLRTLCEACNLGKGASPA